MYNNRVTNTLYMLILLGTISVFNISMWTNLYQNNKDAYGDIFNVIIFAGIYVFGCAYRAITPKIDLERYTLFDNWFNSVFVGRSVATIAELAYGLIWIYILNLFGYQKSAYVFIIMLFIAEIFSWYSVLTLDFIGNVIEETLWTLAFAIIFVIMLTEKQYPLAISIFIYLYYMTNFDVPMYLDKYEKQTETISIDDGFFDALERREVRWDFNVWKPELLWQFGYFSVAVWSSIYLAYYYIENR